MSTALPNDLTSGFFNQTNHPKGIPMTNEPASLLVVRCQDRWATDAQIRAKFLTIEDFIAFSEADAKGLIKIQGAAQPERNTQ